MPLTKAALVQVLFEKEILPKAEAARAVDSVFGLIKQALASGDDVLISGFGKWTVKDKKERRGRNPQTGQDLTINARRVVTFKASGVLRRLISEPPAKPS
ncbi:MAG: integration host factor subunit alpha [Deltaproteobacteria bacterium]|nr:integration host factor subunit alpha [Deltaproteobacteria bacterium]MBW1953124.1 integration host factor subunit alpha [Deltaproteobacteria bacterium]MBW1987002.1 integration host factor subunit alpha [Deltaproteobacteria bacterium]MBW2134041.1 integration host factor subunit alpha [Deltaproteobacteria bacterium]